ncbi:MAG TPA: hypothetical protein VFI65_31795 [Streptosporangiaceae bacterium]|nr:hypothetical protein [Streptosporangiaceae bacterium]
MIPIENRDTEIASKVQDLRLVSLQELADQCGPVGDALLRVLPGHSAQRVAVAAFNSSI